MSEPFQNDTFVSEVEDLLAQIEGAALALEAETDERENINLLFRALHTIKGSSAVVGLDAISKFTHHVETALDRVRSGTMVVTPTLIGLILKSRDQIQELLTAALRGDAPASLAARGADLIRQLESLTALTSIPPPRESAGGGLRTTFKVVFRLKRSSEGLDVDPATLVEQLKLLGPCEATQTRDADAEFSAGWSVMLTTQSEEDAIRDVFIFAPPESELAIERGLAEFVTDPPPKAAEPPAAAKAPQAAESAEPADGAARARAAPRGHDMVRVPAGRLDHLVKLVGELVINQSRLQQAYAEGSKSELAGPVEAMERLISEVRDSVFSIRMMPIGPTFHRFKRLARDLSTQLDKEIELVTEGDETELDKTVLDQLGEPLVHLIRNSMDHGIESPAERIAKGKPPSGRVTLSAEHDGGHVVITIRDDGRGLDRAAIRAKAEEKRLIDPGVNLTDAETFDLIMLPGFSTAQAVSQLSGRGVGMDVVKKTIEGLRGSISITSTTGEGTTIRLSLPLTLAIIDGLLVEIRGDHFIVPMAAVTENVELHRDERNSSNGRNAVAVRGELVPYVRLRELFSINGPELDIERIVIVTLEGQRLGLVVDNVVGSHQTVIQPLGPLYRHVELFSGTTIMGDGRVVMILDLAGTLRHAERSAAQAVA